MISYYTSWIFTLTLIAFLPLAALFFTLGRRYKMALWTPPALAAAILLKILLVADDGYRSAALPWVTAYLAGMLFIGAVWAYISSLLFQNSERPLGLNALAFATLPPALPIIYYFFK